MRHDDKYRTLGFIANHEAIRWLTGAQYDPQRCEVRCQDKAAGADVCCRAFGRGKETIVCLWSNVSKPVNVDLLTKETFASVHASMFSPQGRFLTEASACSDSKTADGGIRISSERHVVMPLNPLEFRILSFK